MPYIGKTNFLHGNNNNNNNNNDNDNDNDDDDDDDDNDDDDNDNNDNNNDNDHNNNNNWTEWSTIQGVIARIISKSDGREARGRCESTSKITP